MKAILALTFLAACGGPAIDPGLRVEQPTRMTPAFWISSSLPALADVAAICDNSYEGRTLIAERVPGAPLVVHDAGRWAMIERASQ